MNSSICSIPADSKSWMAGYSETKINSSPVWLELELRLKLTIVDFCMDPVVEKCIKFL